MKHNSKTIPTAGLFCSLPDIESDMPLYRQNIIRVSYHLYWIKTPKILPCRLTVSDVYTTPSFESKENKNETHYIPALINEVKLNVDGEHVANAREYIEFPDLETSPYMTDFLVEDNYSRLFDVMRKEFEVVNKIFR